MARISDYYSTNLPTEMDDPISNESQWLNTYSRALCSTHDGEHDWDTILCHQSGNSARHHYHHHHHKDISSTSSSPSIQSTSEFTGRNNRFRPHSLQKLHQTYDSDSQSTAPSLSDASTMMEGDEDTDVCLSEDEDVEEQLDMMPTTPGSILSRIVCDIGFNLIDFFSFSEDTQKPNCKRSSSYQSKFTVVNRKVEEDENQNQNHHHQFRSLESSNHYFTSMAGLEKKKPYSWSSLPSHDSWLEVVGRIGHSDDSP